jgi:hypothetical protein
MKYALEIASCDIIPTPNFIQIGSGVQKLFGEDRHKETHTDSKVIL